MRGRKNESIAREAAKTIELALINNDKTATINLYEIILAAVDQATDVVAATYFNGGHKFAQLEAQEELKEAIGLLRGIDAWFKEQKFNGTLMTDVSEWLEATSQS